MGYLYYDGNGNTGGSPPYEQWIYGNFQIYGNNSGLVKTGHTWIGWNTSQSDASAGIVQFVGGEWSVAYSDVFGEGVFGGESMDDVVLYAVWKSTLPSTFGVIYDGNGSTGGSVPVDNSSYANGATITVLGNTGNLVKTGNVFKGWNTNQTNANNGTVEFTQGQSFTINANTMLYAVWQSISSPNYTVTYDGNGNTGGAVPNDSNSPYNSGASVVVLSQGSLVRSGYTFLGWATTSNAPSATHMPGQTFTINSNTTLYAIWQQNTISTYAVTYNANWPNNVAGSGTVPSDPYNPYRAGDSVGVLANPGGLFKSGYTFLGWANNSSAPSALYTVNGFTVYPGSFNMPSSNVTLYAVWQATTNSGHKVTYDANRPSGVSGTGSVPIDNTNYAHQASVTVKANPNSLTADGYDFLGWAYLKSALGTNFGVSGTTVTPPTFVITSSVTLYAVWRSNSVSNGGIFDGPIVLKNIIDDDYKPSQIELVQKIWGFSDGKWAPIGFIDDERCNSWILFTAGDPSISADGLNLFRIQTDGGSPLLVVDRGMVIQKDLSVGGFVSANQGALYLGSGLHTQVDIPKIILNSAMVSKLDGGGLHSVPQVPRGAQWPSIGHFKLFIRTNAVGSNPPNTLYMYNDYAPIPAWEPLGPISDFAGYFDTLYIRQLLEVNNKLTDETPGHLDVGNITLHGSISNMQAGESSTVNVGGKATKTIKFLREFSKIPAVTFALRDLKDANGQYQDKHRYGRITEVTTKQFTIETYTIDHLHRVGSKGNHGTGVPAGNSPLNLMSMDSDEANATEAPAGAVLTQYNDPRVYYTAAPYKHMPASCYFYWQAIEQTQYTVDDNQNPDYGKEKPR